MYLNRSFIKTNRRSGYRKFSEPSVVEGEGEGLHDFHFPKKNGQKGRNFLLFHMDILSIFLFSTESPDFIFLVTKPQIYIRFGNFRIFFSLQIEKISVCAQYELAISFVCAIGFQQVSSLLTLSHTPTEVYSKNAMNSIPCNTSEMTFHPFTWRKEKKTEILSLSWRRNG